MTRPIQLGAVGVITDHESGVFAYRSFSAAALGSLASYARVTLATGDYDLSGWFNSSRYTPQAAGYYQFNAGVTPSGGLADGSYIDIAITVNGSVATGGVGRCAANVGNTGGVGASTVVVTTSAMFSLNGTTNYVELWGRALDNSGAQLASTFTAWFNGFRTSG